MALGILIDSGPLIAYLCRREDHHDWAVETLDAFAQQIIEPNNSLVPQIKIGAQGSFSNDTIFLRRDSKRIGFDKIRSDNREQSICRIPRTLQ